MKDRIKQLRDFLGLSQSDFANKLGVNNSTVSVWEKGGVISTINLNQIAKTFGVSLEWLHTGDGKMLSDTQDTINERIDDRLRIIRRRSNLTQKGLAERLGVSYGTIINWENNGNVPEKQRAKIASTFGVNLSWLETGEGEMLANEPEAVEKELETEVKKVFEEKDVSPREYAKYHGCGDVGALIFENFMSMPVEEQDAFMQCYYKYWRDKAHKN